MQKTLIFPSDEIYDPTKGMNCVFRGIPLQEVVRLRSVIRNYLLAEIEPPYILPYEINDGDELYDYPKHVTPEERERIERVGY